MDNKKDFVERRSGPWDRRIPNMPTFIGKCLQFLYKTKKRLWSILVIVSMGWIWIISGFSIWLYVRIILNVE